MNKTDSSPRREFEEIPFSADAEKGVLGAVLLGEPKALFVCRSVGIAEDSFFLEQHRAIWRAIERLQEASRGIDVLTVSDILKATDELDQIGGREYLSNIIDSCPTPAYCRHYCDTVMEKHTRRRLIFECQTIMRKAYDDAAETADLLSAAQGRLLAIKHGGAIQAKRIKDYKANKIESWRSSTGTGYVGLPSCFSGLNRHLGGYRTGIEVIMAGYRGEGKSTIARQECLFLAKEGVPAAYFSLEDPGDIAAAGMVGNHASRSVFRLDTGNGTEKTISEMELAFDEIGDLPLYIVDASMAIGDIVSFATHLKAAHDIQAIWIDHIQLIRPYQLPHMNRNGTLASYSGQLIELAKRLDISVICLSQLSRSSEKENRKPRLSDLRDSGALEQDARQIVFLYYDPDKETHVLEVAKNNYGPKLGKVEVTRIGDRQRFEEVKEEASDEYKTPDMF